MRNNNHTQTNSGDAVMTDLQAPTNNLEAFKLALQLAVSAPNDEQSAKALKIANQLSSLLTADQVNAVKTELEVEQVDG